MGAVSLADAGDVVEAVVESCRPPLVGAVDDGDAAKVVDGVADAVGGGDDEVGAEDGAAAEVEGEAEGVGGDVQGDDEGELPGGGLLAVVDAVEALIRGGGNYFRMGN